MAANNPSSLIPKPLSRFAAEGNVVRACGALFGRRGSDGGER